MANKDWLRYFLTIADAAASNSKCHSRMVGAVIVRDKFIISTGYNGPPIGYPHCEGKSCPRHSAGYRSGEAIHLCPAAHAERNAIDIAARMGHATEGCFMVLNTSMPCAECAKSIVNAGLVAVFGISLEVYEKEGVTGAEILKKCGVAYFVI